MQTIIKILEKSEILKMIIGVAKLSPNFYKYSIAISKKHSSFLQLIFNTIENPKSTEYTMRALIFSIKIEDPALIDTSGEADRQYLELQRLLYLIPYLMHQFWCLLPGQKHGGSIF